MMKRTVVALVILAGTSWSGAQSVWPPGDCPEDCVLRDSFLCEENDVALSCFGCWHEDDATGYGDVSGYDYTDTRVYIPLPPDGGPEVIHCGEWTRECFTVTHCHPKPHEEQGCANPITGQNYCVPHDGNSCIEYEDDPPQTFHQISVYQCLDPPT